MFYNTLIFVLLSNYYLDAAEIGMPRVIPHILYGEQVKIEDYPYFAGLANCGAAIISERHLLTAAHCFGDPEVLLNARYAYVGGETIQNSQKVYYDQVMIHEKYQLIYGVPINDVAVIRLAKPLKFSAKVQPIKLPTQIDTGSYLEFIGRGIGEYGIPTTELLKMKVERLTTQDCISLIPPMYHHYVNKFKNVLEKINICAKRTNNKPGMCQGDSGSPLVDGGVVVGLASYGGSSCQANRLGFYVNVPYYADWIRKVTGLQ